MCVPDGWVPLRGEERERERERESKRERKRERSGVPGLGTYTPIETFSQHMDSSDWIIA